MEKDIKSNWNAELYDSRHQYVSKYGESLLEWLNPLAKEKICDIGCGTGDLAKKISDAGAKVMGIDNSLSMIEQAKNKFPNIDFQMMDILNTPFNNEFDAVFSNAVLHWVKETDKSASSMFKMLKNGGRLIVEFGGKNNIGLIVNAINKALDKYGFRQNKIKNPWNFLSLGEYCSILEKNGFTIREAIYYDRDTLLEGEKGIQNWIKMFAFFFFENISNELYEEMLLMIEEELRPHLFKNKTWYADYKRLRVKAEKTVL